MEVLVYLVPLALALGFLGLAAFLWSLKSGQYDDLDGAAWRAIMDEDEQPLFPRGRQVRDDRPTADRGIRSLSEKRRDRGAPPRH